jgi:hypothetical protein
VIEIKYDPGMTPSSLLPERPPRPAFLTPRSVRKLSTFRLPLAAAHESRPPKYRNQRLFRPGRQRKQQHLLEGEHSPRPERAIRFKTVSLFLFKTILLPPWGGLYFGGREAFRKYVWENEYFHLTDVKPHTDGTLTREQILTAAGSPRT